MRVSVVGLGKLGSPMAAFYASRGHSVVGADTNPAFVEKLNAGIAPVEETNLSEMVAANAARITATTDIAAAVADTDITFVIVPTPSQADGAFSLDYVLSAVEKIGPAIASKAYHTVVITSTVMPGHTDGLIRPALEAASGKKCGEGFGLCYSPEFIALGSVLHDLANPDFILMGVSDAKAGEVVSAFYKTLFDNPIPISLMPNVSAELSKIAVNTFVTTKIAFANMLADIAERLPGCDVDAVTRAIGQDKRIGSRYLRAAVPYGGPCFPRDNQALTRLAETLGTQARIAAATDAANSDWLDQLAAKITSLGTKNSHVAVLGLSYKPGTPVITESPGVKFAAKLAAQGCQVSVYDPQALENTRRELGDVVRYANSASDAVAYADFVAVMTAWPEFASLTDSDFASDKPVTIYDCWRQFDAARFGTNRNIVLVGRGE